MATTMRVPKATMDKDDLPPRNEHDIRLAGEALDVERVAVAHGVNELSDSHFGGRVCSSDRSHALAALSRA